MERGATPRSSATERRRGVRIYTATGWNFSFSLWFESSHQYAATWIGKRERGVCGPVPGISKVRPREGVAASKNTDLTSKQRKKEGFIFPLHRVTRLQIQDRVPLLVSALFVTTVTRCTVRLIRFIKCKTLVATALQLPTCVPPPHWKSHH